MCDAWVQVRPTDPQSFSLPSRNPTHPPFIGLTTTSTPPTLPLSPFRPACSAGYYSYKWAEVLSADAFGAFEEAGLDNEEGVIATGTRFRDTVLALGGSVAPKEVFELFRGRAPSTEALLRHNGLLPAAA